MDRLGAALEPPDMQAAMGEVDGVPAQRHQLGRPQPVPVGDQHHGGIAVAVAVLPGGSDQAIDLGIGQVLARADLGVRWRRGGLRRSPTVPITVVGATSARCGFVMVFQGFSSCDCPVNMSPYGTLHKARNADFMGTTAISGAAAETVGMRETLNWRILQAQLTPPAMTSKERQRG